MNEKINPRQKAQDFSKQFAIEAIEAIEVMESAQEPKVNTKENKMSIYFDLDETLIHAKEAYSDAIDSTERIRITLQDQEGIEKRQYDTMVRPHANHMLEFCREHAEVRMLTTATREYALKHNEALNLGFNPDQIIAREDYIYRAQLAYGSVYETTKQNTDPNAFLIDNLPPNEEAPKLKMQFLGINETNYIQIREFSGKDPEIFTQELKEILTNLEQQKLVGQNKTAPTQNTIQPTKKSNPQDFWPEESINISNRLASKLHHLWVENHKNQSIDKKFKPINDPDLKDLEI